MAQNKSGARCRAHRAAIKQANEYSERLIESLTEPKRPENCYESTFRNSLADL